MADSKRKSRKIFPCIIYVMAGKKKTKKKVSKKISKKKTMAAKKLIESKQGGFVRAGSQKKWTYPTEEIIEKTCLYLRMGAYLESAVIMAGIPKKVFYEWMSVANDPMKSHRSKKHYIAYRDAVDKAIEECSMKDLECIDKTVTGTRAEFLKDKDGNIMLDKAGRPTVELPYIIPNWKAAAWRLSRRRPAQWGEHKDPQQHNHNHSVDETSNTLKIEIVDAKNPTPNNVTSTAPMEINKEE